jgi:ribosome biogenesis GTPase
MTALKRLGWSDFFSDQLTSDEDELAPRRIASVHRSRVEAIDAGGPAALELPANANTADFAVGDWILADPISGMLVRRLERKTLFQRRAGNDTIPQLVAANVDTLFIVTSCNAEFNLSRLERYLILAEQAGSNPVIVLTKADTTEDADVFRVQAQALQPGRGTRTPGAVVRRGTDLRARGIVGRWEINPGQLARRVSVGHTEDRHDPGIRLAGQTHHDGTIAARATGWRMGDRYTRDPDAVCK